MKMENAYLEENATNVMGDASWSIIRSTLRSRNVALGLTAGKCAVHFGIIEVGSRNCNNKEKETNIDSRRKEIYLIRTLEISMCQSNYPNNLGITNKICLSHKNNHL